MITSHYDKAKDANLELPPGVEPPQLFHSLWQVDFVGIPVPLLGNAIQIRKWL